MFGKYFGPRYFGTSYWGRGGSLILTDPTNLAEAIMARWVSRGLVASVGPLTQARTRSGQAAPTATFRITRGGASLLTSSSSTYEYRIAFCIREPDDGDVAHAKAARVATAFDQCSLFWSDGGKAGRLTQDTWSSRAESKPSAGNELIYADDLEYMARAQGVR